MRPPPAIPFSDSRFHFPIPFPDSHFPILFDDDDSMVRRSIIRLYMSAVQLHLVLYLRDIASNGKCPSSEVDWAVVHFRSEFRKWGRLTGLVLLL